MIFAAGFAEVGAEGGAVSRRGSSELVRRSDATCSGPTPTSTPSRCSATTSTGPRDRAHHPERAPGPADLPGPGPRHPPRRTGRPRGNEVDLEFADFAALVRRAARGRRRRRLHRGVQGRAHARSSPPTTPPGGGVPIVCVKVGRTERGPVDGEEPHRPPHRLRRGRSSAVFRQYGVTRVDGARRAAGHRGDARPRRSRRAGDGVCVYAISGGTGAHMADLARRRRAAPARRSPAATQAALHEWSSPTTCGCRTRSTTAGPPSPTAGPQDPRRASSPTRTSTSLVVPDHRARSRRCRAVRPRPRRRGRDHRQADLRRVGLAARHRGGAHGPALARRRAAVFRTFGNCVQARAGVARLARVRGTATGRRSPACPRGAAGADAGAAHARGAEPGAALSEHESKQLLAAYGIPVTRDVLVRDRGRTR